MYERGRASTVGTPGRPPRRTVATSARRRRCALNDAPARSAISSTTRRPTLCRVSAYEDPGLPSPTTSQVSSDIGGPALLACGSGLVGRRGLGRALVGHLFGALLGCSLGCDLLDLAGALDLELLGGRRHRD